LTMSTTQRERMRSLMKARTLRMHKRMLNRPQCRL
jgi:hypothetical protein